MALVRVLLRAGAVQAWADPVAAWLVLAVVVAGDFRGGVQRRLNAVVRHEFLVLFAGGLLCLSGLVSAEPVADREGDRTGTEVWGDPEDNEQADQGWTWFGMGYENRAGASVRSVDAQSDNADGGGERQRKGKR